MAWAFSISIGLCLALNMARAIGPSAETAPRVRAFEPEIVRLLQEGIDRSATFRQQVQRIDRTNGIVYVQTGSCSASAAFGCLMLGVREAADTRYLRIHLPRRRIQPDERIAIIGHELQHANELLEARWVRNSADAYALFIRIGSAESIRSFETAEAQRVGAAIAGELESCRRR